MSAETEPSGQMVWSRAAALWRFVPGGAMLLHADDGEVVSLNESGAELWRALGSPGTLASLASRLAESHDTDATVIAADLEVLLRHLAERRLVEAYPDA